MSPEQIEKLLAGYATGTLDEAERRALMKAALERQDLFDALAEEEALRELLADRRCRQQLLELLGVSRPPLWRGALSWLQRPAGIAALASSAAAVVLISSLVVSMSRLPTREPKPLTQPRAEPVPRAVDAGRSPSAASPPAAAQSRPAPAATRGARREAPAIQSTEKATEGIAGAARVPAATDQLASSPAQVRRHDEVLGAIRAQAVIERGAAADELAPPAASVTPLVRFSILRQGTVAAPDAEFRTGEPLELRIEAEQPGTVQLFRREEQGTMRLLFPSGEQDNRLHAGSALTIPLAPRTEPGEERLVLVLSPEEVGETPTMLRLRQTLRAKAPTSVSLTPTDPRLRTEIRLRFR